MSLREGEDYYIERGLFVLTAAFLQRRGYCCASGCRHCPYWPPHSGSRELAEPDTAGRSRADHAPPTNRPHG